MFTFPYYLPYEYMMRQISSFVRVLHASPNTGGVDVYANGNLIARNLTYRGFTPYLRISPGQYNIKVYASGTTANPLIDTNVSLNPDTIYTVAAAGTPPNIELHTVVDTRVPITPNRTNIRFVHLSPDTLSVDITLPDGTVLFQDTNYKEATRYIPVVPGRFSLQVREAGTNNILLRVPNINLRPGANISFYLIGLAGGNPGLQVLIPLDGSTYLQS